MKTLVTVFLSLLMAVVLSACQPAVIVKPIIQERMELVAVPSIYTSDVTIPEPPTRESYLAVGPDEREDFLMRYIFDLYSSSRQVTGDRILLRKFMDIQKKRVDEFNASEQIRIDKAKKEAK